MNAPCSGAPLTAPHVTTGGLCRWKAINKVGRHVGLDFYDLLEVASRWLVGWAFASPPQSGLAWLCFLFAGWGSGADRASNDADVSTAPPKIP